MGSSRQQSQVVAASCVVSLEDAGVTQEPRAVSLLVLRGDVSKNETLRAPTGVHFKR